MTWPSSRHPQADAGVPLHHVRKIAGHGSLTTTQRYLHPDQQAVTEAGHLLSAHRNTPPGGARLRLV
jgi:hypothetical protein